MFDGALALAATVVSLLIVASFFDDVTPPARFVALVVLVIHDLSLALRRLAPWAVLSVNAATGLVVVALGFNMVVLHVAPLIALYTVAAAEPRRRSLLAVAITLGALVAAELIAGWQSDLSTIAGNVIVVGVTWLAGSFAYQRHRYIAELETRTEELAAAREELANQAVTEERLRIARELHDVVAHSLSMIAVQSGVGAHVIDTQPGQAKQALSAIEAASRAALDEMRRLVGVLRDADAHIDLAPPAGLDRLGELARSVTESGTTVTVDVTGDARPLPAAIDAALFRVVQEALTNVVRHAHASAARVTIGYGPQAVRVEIVDNGTGSRTPLREGHGISGIRERTRLLDGTVDVESLRDGGFRIGVELPTNGPVA